LDGTIRVWDVGSQEQIVQFQCGAGRLGEIAMFPDGDGIIAEVGQRATLQYWNVSNGTCDGILDGVWDPQAIAASRPWWMMVTKPPELCPIDTCTELSVRSIARPFLALVLSPPDIHRSTDLTTA
jgi:WD40 repeat protein